MVPNEAGESVRRVWHDLPTRFPSLVLDAFVVMPNHVHGIMVLVSAGSAASPGTAPFDSALDKSSSPTLGEILRAFKSLSAIEVNRICGRSGPIWQRNYYDHIIRSGEDLDAIRRYVVENPLMWATDPENPEGKTPDGDDSRGRSKQRPCRRG